MAAQAGIHPFPPRWGNQTWYHIMAGLEQQRALIGLIDETPEPLATMKTWLAVTCNVEMHTNRVTATGVKLAQDAKLTPQQTSRALTRLVRIGALLKDGRGSYRVNPHVAFRGTQQEREELTTNVIPLRREPEPA